MENDDVYKRWSDGFLVRRMTKADAPIVQKWYCAICPTACDLDIVLDDIYPKEVHGFYIGEYNGEVVASAIRIPVCEDIYYGSYYYVDERFRGLGFGRRLRDEIAPPYLGDNILVIDAHDELEEMNKRKGYRTAFKVILYSGVVSKLLIESVSRERKKMDYSLVPASDVDFDKLIAYDNICFVKPNSRYRREIITRWLSIQGNSAAAAVDSAGEVVGYGCRRPAFQSGNHLIGPLYANSYNIAEAIMTELCKDLPGQNVLISICEPNKQALQLVKTFDLKDDLHMVRMHLNGDPKEYKDTVYGITSIDICGF